MWANHNRQLDTSEIILRLHSKATTEHNFVGQRKLIKILNCFKKVIWMNNISSSNSTQHKLGSLKLYVHIHIVSIHNYATDIYKSQECVAINWPFLNHTSVWYLGPYFNNNNSSNDINHTHDPVMMDYERSSIKTWKCLLNSLGTQSRIKIIIQYVMILLAFLLSLMNSDLNQPNTHNFGTTVAVYPCNKLIIKDSYQVMVPLLMGNDSNYML